MPPHAKLCPELLLERSAIGPEGSVIQLSHQAETAQVRGKRVQLRLSHSELELAEWVLLCSLVQGELPVRGWRFLADHGFQLEAELAELAPHEGPAAPVPDSSRVHTTQAYLLLRSAHPLTLSPETGKAAFQVGLQHSEAPLYRPA